MRILDEAGARSGHSILKRDPVIRPLVRPLYFRHQPDEWHGQISAARWWPKGECGRYEAMNNTNVQHRILDGCANAVPKFDFKIDLACDGRELSGLADENVFRAGQKGVDDAWLHQKIRQMQTS